jgi:hypothetical protein
VRGIAQSFPQGQHKIIVFRYPNVDFQYFIIVIRYSMQLKPRNTPLLVHSLRAIFGLLRWFFAIGLVAAPISLISLPTLGHNIWHDVVEVQFVPSSADYAPERDGHHPAGIEIQRLTAKLDLTDADAAGPALVRTVRWTLFLTIFCSSLLSLIMCELLWRLCRNAEKQEFFTEENLKLVRSLGSVIVGLVLLVGAIRTWNSWWITRQIEQHLTFGSLKLPIRGPMGPIARFWDTIFRHLNLDWSFLIIGLLVLALAEVFRQGLALKREADLTV